MSTYFVLPVLPSFEVKQCPTCRKDFDWDGSMYKTHCLDCYKILAKKCSCGRSIGITADKWKKDCAQCYMQKRNATHGHCPLCPEEVRHKLTRPLNKDCCGTCDAKRRGQMVPMTPVHERQPETPVPGRKVEIFVEDSDYGS